MSIILTGDPSNVTTPLTRTITGVADNGAGLFRVTTSVAHLFGDDGGSSGGDTVQIASVTGSGGMTAAVNGTWRIRVIDSTHFDLVGSTFVGVYTSGGTAKDLSLTPQVQIPSDGDQAAMNAGLLSGIQALLDRSQYNEARANPGTYRIYGVTEAGAESVGTSYFASGSWTGTSSFDTTRSQAIGSAVSTVQNDLLLVDFKTTIRLTANIATGQYYGAIRLEYSLDGGTSKFALGHALATVQQAFASNEDFYVPMSLSAQLVTGDPTDSVTFYVNGCIPTSPAAAVNLCGQDAWTLRITQLRAN